MIRSSLISLTLFVTCLSGCSSNSGEGSTHQGASTFNPPATLDGYTRLTAATIKDIPAGGDVTYCQYVMAPFDHDVDVLAMVGYQSQFGHHAAAFTYTPQPGEVPGSTFPCMANDFGTAGVTSDGGGAALPALGSFLGAAGGPSGAPPVTLPEGVGLRLKKGGGIMLNLHYINTGDASINGDAVVDLKFADPDPSRQLAALLINVNLGIDLPPGHLTSSSVDCVAQSDVKIIMMSNHMHEWGASATTDVLPAGGGAAQMLRDDKTWSPDMTSNPTFSSWPIGTPFVLHTGDTLRTTCNWNNTTANTIKFPREMCVGVGFALATGNNPSAPMCVAGAWNPNGL
jgi:hypothetical protein